MTPEAALFLAKARDGLRQADVMIGVDLAEAAGRTAYLAGFHAAQAFLFEATGKVLRSHKGVHAEFRRLTRNDPRFSPYDPRVSGPHSRTDMPLWTPWPSCLAERRPEAR